MRRRAGSVLQHRDERHRVAHHRGRSSRRACSASSSRTRATCSRRSRRSAATTWRRPPSRWRRGICSAAARRAARARVLGGTRGPHRVRRVDRHPGLARRSGRRRCERELAAGYRRIKIKIKPGWDLDAVETVRARFGAIPLMVDANAAYTLADADHLATLDRVRPDDDRAAARLRRHRATMPRCSGGCRRRSASTNRSRRVDIAREAIAAGACRIINIKPGRVGGFARIDPAARSVRGARHPGLARRHARVGHRPRRQHPSVDAAEFLAARRHRREQALLRSRSDRSADRGRRRRHDRGADRARASACRSVRTGSSAATLRQDTLRKSDVGSLTREAVSEMGTMKGAPVEGSGVMNRFAVLLAVRIARQHAPARRRRRAGRSRPVPRFEAEDGVDPPPRGSARAARSGARRHARPARRCAQARRLRWLRRRLHPTSIRLLSDDEARIRRRAALADRPRRARRGRARRWSALLADRDPEVRQMAAFALGSARRHARARSADRGARRRVAARAGQRRRSARSDRRCRPPPTRSAGWLRAIVQSGALAQPPGEEDDVRRDTPAAACRLALYALVRLKAYPQLAAAVLDRAASRACAGGRSRSLCSGSRTSARCRRC